MKNERKVTGAELAVEVTEEMERMLGNYKTFMKAYIGDLDDIDPEQGMMIGMMNELFELSEKSLNLVKIEATEITEINQKLDKLLEQSK